MTERELFFAVCEGKDVPRVPFFPDITAWYMARRMRPGEAQPYGPGQLIPDDSPIHARPGDMPRRYRDWTFLDFYRNFHWGLPIHIYGCLETHYDGVERRSVRDGTKTVTELTSPMGTLQRVTMQAVDGSSAPREHFVKTLDDLAVMRDIVERTSFSARTERIKRVLKTVGEEGVADFVVGRSPFGKLVQEYVGYERVAYWLHDRPDLIREFFEFQWEKDMEPVRMAAESAARVVIISDHADEHLISPPWFEEFCVPFYAEASRILHDAGKLVSTHLDGNFRGHFPHLPKTGFDILDGCTPAPMNNYTARELAAAMPEGMVAYMGVPAGLFIMESSDDEIRRSGREIVEALGRRLILNIGDILPANGRLAPAIELGESAASARP